MIPPAADNPPRPSRASFEALEERAGLIPPYSFEVVANFRFLITEAATKITAVSPMKATNPTVTTWLNTSSSTFKGVSPCGASCKEVFQAKKPNTNSPSSRVLR